MVDYSRQSNNGRPARTGPAIYLRDHGRHPLNATKIALLITFLSILVKGKNHYCQPHPDTTIELLKKFHSIEIGRRWFFQCMLDLETTGLMRRQRRWISLPGPTIESDSSLWWFTLRGAKFLVSKSIRGAGELLKLMTTWLHRDDQRRPVVKDILCNEPITDTAEVLKRIRELVKKIG